MFTVDLGKISTFLMGFFLLDHTARRTPSRRQYILVVIHSSGQPSTAAGILATGTTATQHFKVKIIEIERTSVELRQVGNVSVRKQVQHLRIEQGMEYVDGVVRDNDGGLRMRCPLRFCHS